MFMVGGLLALLARTELLQPGLQFFNPELHRSCGGTRRSNCGGPCRQLATRRYRHLILHGARQLGALRRTHGGRSLAYGGRVYHDLGTP